MLQRPQSPGALYKEDFRETNATRRASSFRVDLHRGAVFSANDFLRAYTVRAEGLCHSVIDGVRRGRFAARTYFLPCRDALV